MGTPSVNKAERNIDELLVSSLCEQTPHELPPSSNIKSGANWVTL